MEAVKLKQSSTGGLGVRLFLYILVVWMALLLAQSLGGSLPEIIEKLSATLEHPFQIRWTENSILCILACTGLYILGLSLYADQIGRTRDRIMGFTTAGQQNFRTEAEQIVDEKCTTWAGYT